MSTYTITRLIRVALRLGDACEVDGIRLEPIVPFMSDQALVSERFEPRPTVKHRTSSTDICFQRWMP